MSQEAQSILNPDVMARADQYRESFKDAAPYPHVCIENFFPAELAQALLAEFPDFERGNFIGDHGEAGGKSTLAKIRQCGPAFCRLDDVIQSPAFLQQLSQLTGIPDLIYDPWYLGGGTHENRNGMSLDPHVDFNYHPSERWHRRLNLIVYLNPLWEAQWGGSLEVFRDPHASPRPDAAYAPLFNRCVIFETSERSWHGFDPIQLPPEHSGLTRRSIALYFYTKDRPAVEIVDRHTTFYVKRQLPERYVDGYTLSAADADELRQLLAIRDQHIRQLYAENTAMRAAEDKGLSGKILYLIKKAGVRYIKKV